MEGMNFSFIIDTSSSMLIKPYGKLSYLNMGKLAIEHFVKTRERMIEGKNDKYFLLNTSESNNIMSGWEHNIQHFTSQLINLNDSTSMTNIPSTIIKAFENMNRYRLYQKADNYLFGSLPSKIQPGAVILVTDGEKLSNSENCLSRGPLPKAPLNKGCDLFQESYRWDERLFVIIIRSQMGVASNMVHYYKQLTQKIAGTIIFALYTEEIKQKLEILANNMVPSIKLGYAWEDDPSTKKALQIWIRAYRFRKMQKANPKCKHLNNSEPIYTTSYIEKWPLPEQKVYSNRDDKIRQKGVFPSYIISKKPLKVIPIDLEEHCDAYDILDLDFLNAIISLGLCVSNKNPNTEENPTSPSKIYLPIQNLHPYKATFGYIKIQQNMNISTTMGIFGMKNYREIEGFTMRTETTTKEYTCTLLVGCYDFQLLSSFNLHTRDELTPNEWKPQLEQYISSIPFYYIQYLSSYLKSQYNYSIHIPPTFPEDRINPLLLDTLRLCVKDQQILFEKTEHKYQIKKLEHGKEQAICCHHNMSTNNKQLSSTDTPPSQIDLRIPLFANKISTQCIKHDLIAIDKILRKYKTGRLFNQILNSSSAEHQPSKSTETNEYGAKEINWQSHELPVRCMGDFTQIWKNKHLLRNPNLTDREQLVRAGVYFGNPFRRRTDMEGKVQEMLSDELDIAAASNASPKIIDLRGSMSDQIPSLLQKLANAPVLSTLSPPIIENENKLLPMDIELANNSNRQARKLNMLDENTKEETKKEKGEQLLDTLDTKEYEKRVFKEHYKRLLQGLFYTGKPYKIITFKRSIPREIHAIKRKKFYDFLISQQFPTRINNLITNFEEGADKELIQILQKVLCLEEFKSHYKDIKHEFLSKVNDQIKCFRPSKYFQLEIYKLFKLC